jgi:phosphoglucomutase
MKVLAVNCGSSSIEWALFAVSAGSAVSRRAHRRIERLRDQAIVRFEAGTGERVDTTAHVTDHGDGLRRIADGIAAARLPVEAVGRTKVIGEHGGFAVRPSGTEAVYALDAESFEGGEPLRRIQAEAQAAIRQVLRAAGGENAAGAPPGRD